MRTIHAPISVSKYVCPDNLGKLRWPHEFYFVDMVRGLRKYNRRLNKDQDKTAAFLATFDVLLVRETLRIKTKLLEMVEAENEELYDKFLQLGQVHEARWAYFERMAVGSKVQRKTRMACLAMLLPPSDRFIGHKYLDAILI